MRRTTILLPDELKVDLARAAKWRKQSESDLIREAITSLLASEPARAKPSLGFVSDGSLTTNVAIDQAIGEAIQQRHGHAERR